MGFSNGILTAPFTKIAANGQGDLQLALNRTTCFSEYQLIADVDQNGTPLAAARINKWAMYKPVKYASTQPLTNAERASVKYGLTVSKYIDPEDLRDEFDTQWAYDQPRSASSSTPLRASDFVENDNDHQIKTTGTPGGYNINAVAPIHGWYNEPHGNHYLGTTDLLASVGLIATSAIPAYSIKLSDVAQDLEGFGDMYIGIMLFSGATLAGSTYKGIKTFTDSNGNDRNISWCEQNNIQFVDIKFQDADFEIASGAPSATYYFVPVISYEPSGTLSAASTKYQSGIYACPNCEIATATINPASAANRLAFLVDSYEFTYAGGRYSAAITYTMWGTQGTYYADLWYDLYFGDSATGTAAKTGVFFQGNATTTHTQRQITIEDRGTMPDYITIVITDLTASAEIATITGPVTSDEP